MPQPPEVPATPRPEALPEEGGRYELQERIGSGGMGDVFRARDQRLHRDVAVKFLPPWLAHDPLALARFHREAWAAASLNHPNILAVYDLAAIDGSPCLVAELLEGQTLRARLKAGPVPVSESVTWAEQIAGALTAAHEKGIVHRDLKPENLYLAADGRVKVLDFGLAKQLQAEAVASDETRTVPPATQFGAVVGTVGYTSPEQARGEPVDARSDLFAFGAVFYELLTGRRPFHRPSSAETTSALLFETPAPPSSSNPAVPHSCDEIVAKALEKDRELRYQSAAEIRSDLLRVRRELTGTGSLPPAALSAPPPRRLSGLVLAVGLTLAAAAALALVLFALLRSRDGVPAFEATKVTVGLGTEAEPAISPDGNFLAYTSDESGNEDIWVLDLRSGSAVQRTSDPAADRRPAWMPDGAELLFVSERDGRPGVWRMPAFGGPATPFIRDADDVAVSPDGRRVAFVRTGASGHLRVAVAPLADVSSARFLTGDGDGLWDHREPAWSPDGAQICYRAQYSIWLVPSAGGRAVRIVESDTSELSPAWSPDGRHVYFSSSREGTEAIWRVDTVRGGVQRVTSGTGPENQPVVSRDGRTLAFSTLREDTNLVFRDLRNGSETTWGTSSGETVPSLAPDARKVFFVSRAHPPNDQLWSMPLADGRPVEDAQRLTDHAGQVSHPACSPDGRWVAYHLIERGRRSIWVIGTGGGQPTQVTAGPADLLPGWSPDARELAFTREEAGTGHIWRMPVRDGRPDGPAVSVTRGRASDIAPAWSPDGAFIAFARDAGRGGGREVWVAARDGRGEGRRLTEGAHAERVQWDPQAKGALWVSGTWGSSRLEMRRVMLDGGTAVAVTPPVLFGPRLEVCQFSLSADGSLLSYARLERHGDIWVGRARQGRF